MHRGASQAGKREPKTSMKIRIAWRKMQKPMSMSFSLHQERLVMSILPRFLVLDMIADMARIDDYLLPQQFHKIYIHRYKDVR